MQISQNGIRIVNLSVSWVTASYYDNTGPINDIINESYQNDNVFWVVSSGNFRKEHWRGGWSDNNSNNQLDFSGTDDRLALSLTNRAVSIFLNWAQYGVNNKTDFDLYVLNAGGGTVASSSSVCRKALKTARFPSTLRAVKFRIPAASLMT